MPTTAPTGPTTRKSTTVNSAAIAERALSAAYSDCHRHHTGSYVPERNLNFCCPITVSLSQARRLMARYVSSYNEFLPKLLLALPATCRVRLARESSVCIYVETDAVLDETKTRHETRCDEFNLCQVLGEVRTYRLWWD